MPVPNIPEDRDWDQESLTRAFRWATPTQRRLDLFHYDLENAIRIMTERGLTEYEGRTLESLKAERLHCGRTRFGRRFAVVLEAGRYLGNESAGVDYEWGFPSPHGQPTFTFALHSSDHTRVVEAEIQTMSERDIDVCNLTDRELRVQFRPRAGHYSTIHDASLTLRRLDKAYTWKTFSHPSEGRWAGMLARAFAEGGFDQTWRCLDKIWLDLSASRPMTRPLKPLSLGVRYWAHNSHPVKVFTPKGAFAGIWEYTVRDTSGKITCVRITLPGSGSSIEIAAGEILELLPCRLECEE